MHWMSSRQNAARMAPGRCRPSIPVRRISTWKPLASFKTKALMQMLRSKMSGSQKVVCALADEKAAHLEFVGKLAESGAYKTVIDRCFPLEQAAQAHRYVESGSRTGAVVLLVEHSQPG